MISRFLKKYLWRLRGYLSVEELRQKGCQIGKDCKIMERVVIDPSHCGQIRIGNRVTIAPQAYLLAHDTSTYAFLGHTYIAKVVLEDDVFIGACAIIMPNVVIGKGSIVGSGSVVTRDVEPYTVVAGNPAKFICSVDDYKKKHQERFEKAPTFGEEYTHRQGVTLEMIKGMNKKMKDGYGYIK